MMKEHSFWYSLIRGIARFYYCFLCGVRIEGIDNYPRNENFILLANHRSAADPVAVGAVFKDVEIYFLAKDSLFRYPVFGWLLKKIHAIPLRRGESDLGAMRTALKVIADGHVLGIFPEGTRNHDAAMKEIQGGIALLALKTKVPVIPVVHKGRYRPFGNLRISIGKPVPLEDLRAVRADTEIMSIAKDRIRDALQKLSDGMDDNSRKNSQ